uniref:Flavin-containing monooxygenase n=1 Tax=Aceria tosichella TaxID=561515 RepID=A0A6G1SJ72_9ACAR
MSSTNIANKTTHPAKQLHVGVIGAGVCGLVSVKICLENGLRVTCFDKSSKYGGLWKYRPDSEDPNGSFEPSVMKTTILNTSKESSAFSDFPPPAWLPNFMRHNHYMDYIESYVDRFKLKPHLKLEHEIIKCWPEWRRQEEREEAGQEKQKNSSKADQDCNNHHIKWLVQVRHLKTNEEFVYEFDRLMVAVGHHNIPFTPSYPGQARFKGEILHSARLKDILSNKKLIDKRVLVVGFGNSACDAANDIAQVAKKCYVSCHRGQWFDGRYLSKRNRWQYYINNWLPVSLIDRMAVKQLERRVDHEMLGLKPKHQPSEQTPAINDLFPYRIITGGIILKSSISTFTEAGVKFEAEDEDEANQEYPIDVAVLATGYEAKISFLDEAQLGIRSLEYNNEYDLFLNMFAPNLTLPTYAHQMKTTTELNNNNNSASKQPNGTGTSLADGGQLANYPLMQQQPQSTPIEAIKSLAFIGLVQPYGSITVVSEMQARYACLVFKGQLELPAMEKMFKDMETMRKIRSRTIRSHSRDQLITNYQAYMDTIATLAGVMPNLTKLFFKDHALWKQLMFGPRVPYQYRLTGPGYWPEARQTILTTEQRINGGINEGKNDILYKARRKCLHDNSNDNNNINNSQDKKRRASRTKAKRKVNNS